MLVVSSVINMAEGVCAVAVRDLVQAVLDWLDLWLQQLRLVVRNCIRNGVVALLLCLHSHDHPGHAVFVSDRASLNGRL